MNNSLYWVNPHTINDKNDLHNLAWFDDFQHYIGFFKRVGDSNFSVDVNMVASNVLSHAWTNISDHYTTRPSSENVCVLTFAWENLEKKYPIHVCTLNDALQVCRELQQKIDQNLIDVSLWWIYEIEHKLNWHIKFEGITPYGVWSIRTMMYDKTWLIIKTKSLLEQKKILYDAQYQIELMIKKIHAKKNQSWTTNIIENSQKDICNTIAN